MSLPIYQADIGLPRLSLPEFESICPNFSGYLAFKLSHIMQGYPPEKLTPVRFRYVPSSPSASFKPH
ncbi:hypothetical protein, partial [Limnohabitans sp. Rim47]|uniref:hypothetical protein n=1 Tax=Limnohabitans sp. Rim47 TaxID=1100721 RepID=UPI001ED91456